MKKGLFLRLFPYILIIIFCEAFDYVYVDNQTLKRQLSFIANGFVSVVLQIDPSNKNTASNYTAPGRVIKDRVFEKKNMTSVELIQLISEISKRNQRYSGEGWHPTFKIFIKYTDKFLFFIPSKKYLGIIFDFRNSIIFIEGRKFVFKEQEARLLQEKLDFLLNKPPT
jgi:hypothetical protein